MFYWIYSLSSIDIFKDCQDVYIQNIGVQLFLDAMFHQQYLICICYFFRTDLNHFSRELTMKKIQMIAKSIFIKKIQELSFEICLMIAKRGFAYSVAEKIMKPAVIAQ